MADTHVECKCYNPEYMPKSGYISSPGQNRNLLTALKM